MSRSGNEAARLLADPTRFEIYQSFMAKAGGTLTVAEVAREFDLHPNVARMHLEKLSGAGLLSSEFRKALRGGRPARVYRLGDQTVGPYPPRQYQLLADIALSAISEKRPAGTLARERGREDGRHALAKAGVHAGGAGFPHLVASLEEFSEEQGLFARLSTDNQSHLELKVFNCVFKELSIKHFNVVCRLHRQYLLGLCESHLGKVKLTSKCDIARGGSCCSFLVCLNSPTA